MIIKYFLAVIATFSDYLLYHLYAIFYLCMINWFNDNTMQILFNNVKTDLSKLSMEKIELKSAKIIVTHFTAKLLMKTQKLTKYTVF